MLDSDQVNPLLFLGMDTSHISERCQGATRPVAASDQFPGSSDQSRMSVDDERLRMSDECRAMSEELKVMSDRRGTMSAECDGLHLTARKGIRLQSLNVPPTADGAGLSRTAFREGGRLESERGRQ